MPTQKQQIALRNRLHRARYRCPNGHSSWEATNGHWWCQSCAKHWETDPVFYELRDEKTGRAIRREEVTLYDDDHTGDDADLYKGRG